MTKSKLEQMAAEHFPQGDYEDVCMVGISRDGYEAGARAVMNLFQEWCRSQVTPDMDWENFPDDAALRMKRFQNDLESEEPAKS